MKKILFTLVAAVFTLCATAQNSAVTKAQTLLQENKATEALQILEDAMKNEKTTKFAEVYHFAAQAEFFLFYNELVKASENMPFDTLAFAGTLNKAQEYALRSHAEDTKADAKGRVKPKMVAQNLDLYTKLADYVGYPGSMLYANGDKLGARECFRRQGAYLDTDLLPQSAKDSIYAAHKDDFDQADFFVTVISNEIDDYDGVIASAAKQANNPKYARDIRLMKIYAYEKKGDELGWLEVIKSAILTDGADYADELVRHYQDPENPEKAAAIAEELIAANGTNPNAWFLKGRIALVLKSNTAEALEAFNKVLELDANFGPAYYNASMCHMQNATELQNANRVKNAAKIKAELEAALPLMEKYRQLAPDQVRQWATYLSMIYDNLKMPEKAAEMDNLLK